MKIGSKNKRLSFQSIDPDGIPLSEIIAIQEQFHEKGTLAENIGDAFLFAHNQVFRNVREEYLRLGFHFRMEDPCHYFDYSLMSLDEIYDLKTIPYRNNFVWLKKIDAAANGVFTLSELRNFGGSGGLKYNYVFHESAHFIAHHFFFKSQSLQKIPKSQDSFFRIMLGESFANLVEALSSLYDEGEVGDYFLDSNCYYRPSLREAQRLAHSSQKFGISVVAKILFCSFLYANFLYDSLGTKELKQIALFANAPPTAPLSSIIKIGLDLSKEFRTKTTPYHLYKIGFRGNLQRYVEVDPLIALQRSSQMATRAQVEALLQIATQDLSAKVR